MWSWYKVSITFWKRWARRPFARDGDPLSAPVATEIPVLPQLSDQSVVLRITLFTPPRGRSR